MVTPANRARLDELRRFLDPPHIGGPILIEDGRLLFAEIDRLLDELDEAEKALRVVQHSERCATWLVTKWRTADGPSSCDCGLDEALARMGEKA